jgi:hypothetical protein
MGKTKTYAGSADNTEKMNQIKKQDAITCGKKSY